MPFNHLAALCLLILAFATPNGARAQGDLANLYLLKTYKQERISSYDLTGGNDDGNWKNAIQPGETRTIGDVEGPGIITHIWFTIATGEHYHLKKIVLRMYWDDEQSPAVESPIGDFFGLGLGEYFQYESGPLSVGSQKAMNCYFPMPFRKKARITITNEGDHKIDAFYYNIDWQKHNQLPDDTAYFYAEYRQATPTPGRITDWSLNSEPKVNDYPNLDGADNYVMMETEGRGHFVGVTHSIMQNQGDWWGEGDEMIFVDNRTSPTMTGTGSEDYYLGAWCYGGCGISPFGSSHPTFAFTNYGNPLNGGDDRGAKWMVYRFHTDSPIPFNNYFKMTMEHGHANHRSDNWYTVAYWYQQATAHKLRKPLPPVAERLPKLINVEGPTMGKP